MANELYTNEQQNPVQIRQYEGSKIEGSEEDGSGDADHVDNHINQERVPPCNRVALGRWQANDPPVKQVDLDPPRWTTHRKRS